MKGRKVLRVTLSAAFMLCAAFALLVFSPIASKAAGKPGFYNSTSTLLLYDNGGPTYYNIKNLEDGDKVVKATSSNKKIATVTVKKFTLAGKTNPSVVVKPKKAGTTTITCVIRRDGKNYKSKMKVTVVNYSNPLKSFKYNGKEYVEKFNEKPSYYYGKKAPKKGKISVKANSEWSIVQIFTYSRNTGKGKNWKNNKTVNPKGATQLSVMVRNKKNKDITMTLHLSFGS